MSCVLIYTSPARGHLYPILDVALELRRAGHRVVVQTLAQEADHVQSAGLHHRAIAGQIEAIALADYRVRGTKAQLEAALSCWSQRAVHEVADLRASISRLAPDLLITDANCWGAAALAESTGRPWAMYLPYCLPVPSVDAPAFGPGLSPPRTAAGRLRDRVIWAVHARLAGPHVGQLNSLRAQIGVPQLSGLPELYQRSDLLLYRTAEPFEYPRSDWPANVHLLGPGLWAPPSAAPDWVADLPRPRVLVSVSTELQQDGAIIESTLRALAEEPGSIIVTTSALDPRDFVAPHEHTRIERFLPHAALMDAVDVVVTHGGMGTTQRALAAGVPLVVVPWGRDQQESARRVEHCGAGVRLSRRRLTPGRIRAAVRSARARTDQAGTVARAFAAAGGAPLAVERLEDLTSGGRIPSGR